jgi:membrane-bound lytic murein transglycosylase D
MLRVVLAIALLLSSLHAGAGGFPRPASLEPAVQFWVRVYTEITTNQGYIHDAVDMGVIYETLELPKYASNRKRDQLVKDAKARVARALTSIAKGKRSKLTDIEARVLAAWPEGTSASAFKLAADNVRFQLGQSNRFMEGMVRSGQWKPHIRQVLAAHKLPPELDVLPHVESSFNPSVYSKVAAAGMWQFMPATARNYMRVDHVVDARLDPFIATEGAAKLLQRNYDVTGTWPLALTAYNHGTTGVMRAANSVGTRDIGTIVQQYRGPYFGFASRNFYASFLAALEVDRNAERYFGPLQLEAPTAYDTVVLGDYIPARTLAQSAGISLDQLRQHNPALRDPVWTGEKYIPVGQVVRVPRAQLKQPLDTLLASLPANARFGNQKPDVLHRIAPGDSLSTIAARYGTTVSKLMSLNGMRNHKIRAGKTLILPGNVVPEPSVAARSGGATPAGKGHVEYVIRRGDSLWSIARRFNVSQQQLVAWNDISPKAYIQPGQKLRVPSSI